MAQRPFGEPVGQHTSTQRGGKCEVEAPLAGSQLHDVDAEDVAGFRCSHVDGPGHRVGSHRELGAEREHIVEARVACDLATPVAPGLEDDLVAGVDREHRRMGGVDDADTNGALVGREAVAHVRWWSCRPAGPRR